MKPLHAVLALRVFGLEVVCHGVRARTATCLECG